MVRKLFSSQTVSAGGSATSEWVDVTDVKDLTVYVDLGNSGSTSVKLELLQSPKPADDLNDASSVSTDDYVSYTLASSVGSSGMQYYDATDAAAVQSVAVKVTETGATTDAVVTLWLVGHSLYP